MPVWQVCTDAGGTFNAKNATVNPSTSRTSATRDSCLDTRMFTRSGTEKLGGLVIIWTEEDEENKLNQQRITCGADMLLEAHLDDPLTGEWAYLHHTTTASLCVCALQCLQPLCRVICLTSQSALCVCFPAKRKLLWHLCRWRCLTSCWSFV